MTKRMRAAVLPATLILLLLVNAILALSYVYTSNTESLIKIAWSTTQRLSTTTDELLSSFPPHGTARDGLVELSPADSKDGPIDIAMIGAIDSSAPGSSAHRFDYASLLAGAVECAAIESATESVDMRPTASGDMISARSSRMCRLGSSSHDHIRTSANLVLDGEVRVGEGSSDPLDTVLLATPGSIEQHGMLVVCRDGAVFAGGDLSLDRISVVPARTSGSSAPLPLTVRLISATGRITVGAVDESVRLLVLAHHGIDIRGEWHAAADDALPPFLNYEILALGWRSDL